jgi:hypothetical protein
MTIFHAFKNSLNVASSKNNIFLIFYPCGKAGGIQIRRCQGIAVNDYGGTLGALALNPSGFCNVGVSFGDFRRLLLAILLIIHLFNIRQHPCLIKKRLLW